MSTTKVPKRQMPKHGIVESVEAKIEIRLLHDFDRFNNGAFAMTMTDAKVSEGGKEVGSIRFEAGGRSVIAIIGSRSWGLSVRELWPLFAETDRKYCERKP